MQCECQIGVRCDCKDDGSHGRQRSVLDDLAKLAGAAAVSGAAPRDDPSDAGLAMSAAMRTGVVAASS